MATRGHSQKPGVARRWSSAVATTLVVVLAGGAVAGEPVPGGPAPPEPKHYRMDDYRTATPMTLAGAKVLDTATIEAVWSGRTAVLLDVMPRPEKPAGLPTGTIWRDTPRANLPGSMWLPNAGYGVLPPDVEQTFADSLAALTAGDQARPLVFYCRRACWMSWNAAKRALSLGYRDVGWYPDGTDGWTDAGLPLEPARPYQPQP